MSFLDEVEAAGAILGGIAPGVQRLADEDAVEDVLSPCVRHLGHRQDFIDDARQLETGLRAVDLRHVDLAVEVIELLVEDADEEHVLRARMLKVRDPADHLAAVQPVGAADVRLAGLLGEGLGLLLGPLEAQATGDRDRVDEDRGVLVECARIAELGAGLVVVRLAVGSAIRDRRVGARR